MNKPLTGSKALIQSMINQNIKYVFGIPGAKVDQFFEDLQDSKDPKAPKLIVTRHEQNAAFIAAAIGRLTGEPGVVAVTSGPGVSNLATGLITATSEGDPVIAIGGQVKRDDLLRLTHQSINNADLLRSTTKTSVEVQDPNNISETFSNAYISAQSPKKGAAFLSLPQDILSEEVTRPVIDKLPAITNGSVDKTRMKEIAELISQAKQPVILAGMRSSTKEVSEALHALLRKFSIPVVETYQGAGVISKDLVENYYGRVSLFDNQIGDTILKNSDLVIAIGYDPVEYEARNWNQSHTQVINIDTVSPEITAEYQPKIIVNADIAESLTALTEYLDDSLELDAEVKDQLHKLREHFTETIEEIHETTDNGLHPISVIQSLQKFVNEDTIVTVDIGSHYIWMGRYFKTYKPRHLLFSNGMQTLGVSLPWAIGAALTNPDQPVISISGDGGFLFSGQELETAVRLKLNIIQLIWVDGYYDMVKFQEVAKYGHDAGVKFGYVDYVKYAESFGATGIRANDVDQLDDALKQASEVEGPVIIEIPVDYKDNIELKTKLIPNEFN
ncbi:acetolactate synthase AlsS [Apilactobacillus apinorum]|uniref:acetolactate synthase AlsS n=1 Tax=Apilactobacillus apinorum TaxID=1218495 RepID=UPI0006B54DA3|nr:acetolactate synthase AlsS [Apilactobacillus apinorum]KOY68262.1 Acetolactate synthase [Apilactobacillus apinorum]CAI2692079.1 als Acetolactate synthase [Apilactobacillus apinorum]